MDRIDNPLQIELKIGVRWKERHWNPGERFDREGRPRLPQGVALPGAEEVNLYYRTEAR